MSSNKKVLKFRDYLNAIKKLKKVADDLEDINKQTGLKLSDIDATETTDETTK